MKLNQEIALCSPRRTPFAQFGKSLSPYGGHHLGKIVAEDILEKTKIPHNEFDGVIVGEGFSNAPNSARVVMNLLGMPNEIPAVTVANNCVSGMEAVVEAARRIALGEGSLYLCIGEESQTSMPFIVKGARLNKKTATVDKLKATITELPEGVEIRDTLDDGLGDGETSYGMQVTAEILAQNYALPRELTDKLAYESFKRAYEATTGGLYSEFLIPVKDDEGNMMKEDEAVMLRKGIVENPGRMAKAMLMFENPQMKFVQFKEKYGKYLQKSHGPTLSIFNASPRSDGAAGVIVCSVEKAKKLGLQIDAVLTGWKMYGVDPNLMGIAQAFASVGLLKDMNLSMNDVDQVEIHEAFAATAVSALVEIQNQTGYEWEKKFDEKKINQFGGSIAIGHPFGATGIRLIANAVMDFRHNPDTKRVMLTACAHGGVAGSLMVERYKG
ncbi:MAG: thiolase family protein [Leptospiraceae bacterium]|nr:thiolase family protein [Leptospiraceae bacterium]